MADAKDRISSLTEGWIQFACVRSGSEKLMSGKLRSVHLQLGCNKDAIDLKYAKEVADYIGSEHTGDNHYKRGRALGSLEDVIGTFGNVSILQQSVPASMGMYLICKAIHEADGYPGTSDWRNFR